MADIGPLARLALDPKATPHTVASDRVACPECWTGGGSPPREAFTAERVAGTGRSLPAYECKRCRLRFIARVGEEVRHA